MSQIAGSFGTLGALTTTVDVDSVDEAMEEMGEYLKLACAYTAGVSIIILLDPAPSEEELH